MRVRAENIELSYDTHQILKSVSIDGKDKEFVGLIGPNGSGKSTLLRCIYRVLSPDAGKVFLDDKPLEKMSYKESARHISVLAQHNNYNFDFSVLDIVLMGRSPHKRAMELDTEKDRQIAKVALETVGLSSFAKRSFSTLSGGEQQRVVLARALAQQTSCLILDEPTNHLDITHQLDLLRIVKQLDVTVISAIHDLNIAAMFCDRIFALKDGAIIAQGTPREVLTPEFIREVYQVNSEIVNDSEGNMHILFY